MNQETPRFMELVELADDDPIASITGGTSPWLVGPHHSVAMADPRDPVNLSRALGDSMRRG